MANTKIMVREGAKDRYLAKLYQLFPQHFTTYIEPFTGTGSVFLGLDTPKHTIINDHDKFIYWFFLVMSTYRGAEKLAQEIEKTLVYYSLMDSMQMLQKPSLLLFLAHSLIKQNTSLYSYGQTLKSQPSTSKDSLVSRLIHLKEFYISRLKNTYIFNKSYDSFLKSISSKHDSYKDYFVYCDPPYVSDKGSLASNKNFKQSDLENMLDILASRDWKFAISCMDQGVEFYQSKGLTISLVAKSVGISASKGHIKHEYLATNYIPIRYEQTALF